MLLPGTLGHAVQVAALAVLELPLPHRVQLVAPAVLLYCPTPHGLHGDPDSEYCPGVQRVHAVAPAAGDQLPPAHTVHAIALAVTPY